MLANAAKGPEYRSLRVHGMGGAFVAVADNKDALYYNPAGLNLINRMGNFEKNPEMGYMPNKSFEVRLFTISGSFPANIITNVLDICGAPTIGRMVSKMVFLNFGYFTNINYCPDYWAIIPDNMGDLSDSLYANQHLADRLTRFDRLPVEMGGQVSFLEFAMHNFGFSLWLNSILALYMDTGVIMPAPGYEPVQVDVAMQTAFAFSPVDKWSIGIGLKAVNRYLQPGYDFHPQYDLEHVNYKDELDTLKDRWKNADDLLDIQNFNFGFDFGVLYQITRQVRLGTSLRNVFFSELAGETITPNLSFGAMASPIILQSNSMWGRKVNFAMDYVDVLNDNLSDMPLSHLNFGTEVEQTVIPSPTKNMKILTRTLFGVLGGVAGLAIGYLVGEGVVGGTVGGLIGGGTGALLGADIGGGRDLMKVSLGCGFEGGYLAWTTAFALGEVINMRFASYSEERGFRTGQKEHRLWTGEFSVGF